MVYISGATGQFPEVSLADNTDTAKHYYCGVAAETKGSGATILIRVRGELTGLDTDAFLDSDELYLSTGGALTKTKPTGGAVELVGYCSYSHATLGKIVIMHHAAHSIHVPSGDDIVIRMGDNDGAKKVYFKDYANVEVAFIDSDGKADFTSLTLGTPLLIAEGGTNSDAALANNLVMVSSGGAIVEGVVTVTELGRLDGLGGIIVTDVTECTDLEGTALSITEGVLNVTEADPTVDSDAEIKAILVDEVTKTGDFTAGRMAKINNTTGIIEQGTNTDTDVADAVTKKHTQDTDQYLDYGGANQVAVADAKDAVTKKHSQNTDTDLDATFEATFVKKADTVNVLSDITSAGADIEDAVTKKHTQNTDTAAGGEWDFGANTAGFTIQTANGDGTTTIDWTAGNYFKFTHGAMPETFTFDPAPTKPGHLTLIVIQDGVGGRDCIWPVPVKWLGAEPTWTDGGGGKGIVVAMVYDGTSYWSQGTPWEE
ncbi:hypothetical protein ES708_17519 [subsurface metagenome]